MAFNPGVVDYSDDPILPAWYVPGFTVQNMESTTYSPAAPPNYGIGSSLPSDIVYCNVTGSYNDGNGNALGGYLTFEQSNDLIITDTTGQNYRVPARLVGNFPIGNMYAWNAEGSGKCYLQYGMLSVVLMANDQPNVTSVSILEPYYKTQEFGWVAPTSWVYHVKEYFLDGMQYDITVPSADASSPVDINSLLIASTYEPNHDWNRGY